MEAVERLRKLFRGHESAHGIYTVSAAGRGKKVSGKAETLAEPMTDQLWAEHLDGKNGLGVIPIREDSKASWGAIDVDQYPLDHKALIARIEDLKLPLVVCRSKSGGAHLYLFLSKAIPAGDVQDTLKEWASLLGHAGVEVFPKQRKLLVDQGDKGNWLNMPYEGTRKRQTLRYGFDAEGNALDLDAFLKWAESRVAKPKDLEARFEVEETSSPLPEAPPCLQALEKMGFPPGTRHDGLFNMAVYFRKAYPEGWEAKVEEAAQTTMRKLDSTPIPSGEIQTILKSARRKEYFYKCTQPPINSYCNKEVCRTRQHGVGGPRGVEIANVAKLCSDPPIWFLDVGGERLDLETDDLFTFRNFQRVCMERLNLIPPNRKQDAWHIELMGLLENVHEIAVPIEVKLAGQFQELIETFVGQRATASEQDEILLGRPWPNDEDGQTYFRLTDLETYIERRRVKGWTRPRIVHRLREIGASHSFAKIKSRGINLWAVPTPHETEEIKLPKEVKSDVPF